MASAFCLRTENRGSKQEPQGVGTPTRPPARVFLPAGCAQGAQSACSAPSGFTWLRCRWSLTGSFYTGPLPVKQHHFLCNKQKTDRIEKTGEPQGHPRTAGILRDWKGQCATVYVSHHLHRVGSSSVQVLWSTCKVTALFLDASPEPMAVGRKGANRIRRASLHTAGLPSGAAPAG